MLTQARLKELLRYEPKTGHFYWLHSWGCKGRVLGGKRTTRPAGSFSKKDGYWHIRVDDVLYPAHRLAWLYMYGKFPKTELDHINTVRDDNRIVNLRKASRVENTWNAGAHRDNRTGFKGVTRTKFGWIAQMGYKYKNVYLGTYSTAEEAHAAYCAAVRELHGEFFNSGSRLDGG